MTSTSLELHYYSMRQGLASWVEGLIEGVARLLHGFSHPVVLKLLRGREDKGCDHEVILHGPPVETSMIAQQLGCAECLPFSSCSL